MGDGCEDGLLCVEAVFCLLEDGVGVALEDFFGDFFLAVGRKAVEDDVPFGCVGEELGVDLVVAEESFFFSLAFLSHGEPDVGVNDVGVCDGLGWV